MVLVEGQGISLESSLFSASPLEITLAGKALQTLKMPCNGRD
jgi:hypothetical protein